MLRSSFVAILLVLAGGCSVVSIDLTPRIQPLEEQTVEGRGENKILLMDFSGLLTDEVGSGSLTLGTAPPRVPLLVRVREELQKASRDPKVRALVIKINSPGGTVTASDILFHEIDTFRRRNKTPIVAVMMDVAASGGYYVALAADTIVAHPTTVTGSIGVILLTVNADGLLQKIGVTTTAIKSGPLKDMGSPLRSLTPEERAIFQSVIDDLHGQFVAKVAELELGSGFNADTGTYADLLADGVLDPVKVTRSALANAGSIAAMLLTTETLVVDKPEDEEAAAAAGHGHGHGHGH